MLLNFCLFFRFKFSFLSILSSFPILPHPPHSLLTLSILPSLHSFPLCTPSNSTQTSDTSHLYIQNHSSKPSNRSQLLILPSFNFFPKPSYSFNPSYLSSSNPSPLPILEFFTPSISSKSIRRLATTYDYIAITL